MESPRKAEGARRGSGVVSFLEIRHLSKAYVRADGRVHPALADISMDVEAGEVAAVLGPSGCGKTTLLNLIAGLDRDFQGTLRMPRVRIGLVFQEPRLLPWMTAEANVAFALSGHRLVGRDGRAEVLAQAREWLARVGLAGHERAYPHQLSVGMQQRVALARAFAVEPQLLLMDEPFSALDEVTAHRIADQVMALWEATRPTVVLVTHRVEEAVFFADRIWVLTAGPARVAARIPVPLARPRRRGKPEFWQTVERVRAAVHDAARLEPRPPGAGAGKLLLEPPHSRHGERG